MGGKKVILAFNTISQKDIETDPAIGQTLLLTDALWFRFFSKHDWWWLFNKRGRRVFCYSRVKIDGKYLSWQYVCQRKGGPLKMHRRIAHHRHRYRAKAKARRQFEEYLASQNGDL